MRPASMRPTLAGAALVLALPLLPAPARARTVVPCAERCDDTPCALAAGRCWLASENPKQAKDLLKAAARRDPQNVPLALLLARTYAALGNRVWAKRVLYRHTDAEAGKCEARSWLVWLHLGDAELEQAEDLLRGEGCPRSGPGAEPQRVRWALLSAALARLKKDREAAGEAVNRAYAGQVLYPEDRPLLKSLTGYALPHRVPPLRLRLELGGGYTSDGLGSSPADVAGSEEERSFGSMVITTDLLLQLELPWGYWFRPLGELSLRSQWLTAGEPVRSYTGPSGPTTERLRDFSFVSARLRLGAALGPLRLYYSGAGFLLSGGDEFRGGPRLYYESHRGELEWDPKPWLSLWLGTGRTIFREGIRSRTELDGGLALSGPLGPVSLLGGVTGRGHFAGDGTSSIGTIISPYTLWGGSLITSATLPLPPWLTLRGRVILSLDVYPRSAGYFRNTASEVVGEPRRDLLLKGALEAWSQVIALGLRVGLSYEPSHRFPLTAADAFRYTEHRVLLRLRGSWQWDPWSPGDAAPRSQRVALPRAAEGRDPLEEERIQDILRQEDAVRRGSSCVN